MFLGGGSGLFDIGLDSSIVIVENSSLHLQINIQFRLRVTLGFPQKRPSWTLILLSILQISFVGCINMRFFQILVDRVEIDCAFELYFFPAVGALG